MAKMRVTWREVATYTVDIETALTAAELEEVGSGDGEDVWFALVEEQHEHWSTQNLMEVSEREVLSIHRVSPARTSEPCPRTANDNVRWYAEVRWCYEDVLEVRPDWTREQCEEFLYRYQDAIRDRMTEVGWGVIDTFLPAERKPEESEPHTVGNDAPTPENDPIGRFRGGTP